MPKTVTIEVPDELIPRLDLVLAYWRYRHTDEATLQLIFQHGVNMMSYRDGPPGPDDNQFNHPRIEGTGDLDDGIPF